MSVASCQSICLLPIHLSFCCPLGFCSRNFLLSKTDPVSTVKYLAGRVMPDTLLDTVGKETVLTTVSLLLTFRLWAVLGLEAKPWKGECLVLIHIRLFFVLCFFSSFFSPLSLLDQLCLNVCTLRGLFCWFHWYTKTVVLVTFRDGTHWTMNRICRIKNTPFFWAGLDPEGTWFSIQAGKLLLLGTETLFHRNYFPSLLCYGLYIRAL